MKKRVALLLCLCLIGTLLVGCNKRTSSNTPVKITTGDKEVDEAISKARESLDHFWSVYDSPKEGEANFSLKVKVQDSNGNVEHLWAIDLKKDNGKIFGTIDNDPKQVKTLTRGQKIEIADKDIVDWMYRKNGKIYGGYTIRVLVNRIPKADADAIKSQLSDKPY